MRCEMAKSQVADKSSDHIANHWAMVVCNGTKSPKSKTSEPKTGTGKMKPVV